MNAANDDKAAPVAGHRELDPLTWAAWIVCLGLAGLVVISRHRLTFNVIAVLWVVGWLYSKVARVRGR
jgi:hypothetical protein